VGAWNSFWEGITGQGNDVQDREYQLALDRFNAEQTWAQKNFDRDQTWRAEDIARQDKQRQEELDRAQQWRNEDIERSSMKYKVQDAMAAGLHPMSVTGGGGGGSVVINPQPMLSAGNRAPQMPSAGHSGGGGGGSADTAGIGSILQLAGLANQYQNDRAQRALANAQADKASAEANAIKDDYAEGGLADIQKKLAQLGYEDAQLDKQLRDLTWDTEKQNHQQDMIMEAFRQTAEQYDIQQDILDNEFNLEMGLPSDFDLGDKRDFAWFLTQDYEKGSRQDIMRKYILGMSSYDEIKEVLAIFFPGAGTAHVERRTKSESYNRNYSHNKSTSRSYSENHNWNHPVK